MYSCKATLDIFPTMFYSLDRLHASYNLDKVFKEPSSTLKQVHNKLKKARFNPREHKSLAYTVHPWACPQKQHKPFTPRLVQSNSCCLALLDSSLQLLPFVG